MNKIFNSLKSKKRLISEINTYTGGKITDHHAKDPEITLSNCFVSQKNIYLGNLATAKSYLDNNFVICSYYPTQVALKLKRKAKNILKEHPRKLQYITENAVDFEKDAIGYVGISHYGDVLFKIGDKIFDKNFKIESMDQLSAFDYIKYVTKMQITGVKSEDYLQFVNEFIPFQKRGTITIETRSQCKLAALRFSTYFNS